MKKKKVFKFTIMIENCDLSILDMAVLTDKELIDNIKDCVVHTKDNCVYFEFFRSRNSYKEAEQSATYDVSMILHACKLKDVKYLHVKQFFRKKLT